MPDVANVLGDSWKITVGASELEFTSNVSMGGVYELHDIVSQLTGTDVLGQLVQGRRGDLAFEVEETTIGVLQRGLGLSAAGDVLAPGPQLPTETVLLHPATLPDLTKTFDLFFYAVSFGTLERTADGQGPAMWKLTAKALRDSAGKIVKLGA